MRYIRQEIFNEIGKKGQQKLGKSTIAIVGLGALGSVSAELLTRAGIGRLILIDRDIVELKRVVNKLKKTCDAIEGDIAGFGEDWVVVTPGFAHVYRTTETEEVKE